MGHLSAARNGLDTNGRRTDDDKGASLTWIATDFERKDDVGIPMPPSKTVACKSFPLAAFDFPEIKYAGGDLQVQ